MITLNPAEKALFEYLKEKGHTLSPSEIKDFSLHGHETDSQVIGYANDYISDIRTDEAEARAFKKFPHMINPIDY